MSSSRPIQRSTSGGFLNRMIRAARLDATLYAELTADATATRQALTVVALVALAHGVGGIIRGVSFEWNPLSGSLFGMLGEIAFFSVASLVIYLLGRYVLGGKATYAQVVRPLGFSVVPGLLILIAALASLPGVGVEAHVFIVLAAWRLAAGYIAVRQALVLGAWKCTVALLAGVLSGMVAVVIATRVLFGVLRLAGVSS